MFISFVREDETKTNTSANTSLLYDSKSLQMKVDLGTHMTFP